MKPPLWRAQERTREPFDDKRQHISCCWSHCVGSSGVCSQSHVRRAERKGEQKQGQRDSSRRGPVRPSSSLPGLQPAMTQPLHHAPRLHGWPVPQVASAAWLGVPLLRVTV